MKIVAFLKKRLKGLLGSEKPKDDKRLAALEKRCDQLQYLLLACMPEENRKLALEILWNNKKPTKLDLDNPQTFTEKIQAIKLHGDDPLLTKLADKYAVRPWVAERIGERYLIPILGAWDSADAIDFDKLPEKFVLKANHGYHMNIIVTDKNRLDEKATRRTLTGWLKTNFAFAGRLQMQYRSIKPKIIAEEYIENFNGEVADYKLWCFKGKVHYIQYMIDRNTHLHATFFDRDWAVRPIMYNRRPMVEKIPDRPSNLCEMIALAERLSEGFEFVRVDLYRLNDGTIKFGEMTFTPANGYGQWSPPEMDAAMGAHFDIREGNRTTGALL